MDHWKDHAKSIRNLYNVLKDNGLLLIYAFIRH